MDKLWYGRPISFYHNNFKKINLNRLKEIRENVRTAIEKKYGVFYCADVELYMGDSICEGCPFDDSNYKGDINDSTVICGNGGCLMPISFGYRDDAYDDVFEYIDALIKYHESINIKIDL